ncbi:hypothetical protein ACG7TL_007847 [Trametes sanguinea]
MLFFDLLVEQICHRAAVRCASSQIPIIWIRMCEGQAGALYGPIGPWFMKLLTLFVRTWTTVTPSTSNPPACLLDGAPGTPLMRWMTEMQLQRMTCGGTGMVNGGSTRTGRIAMGESERLRFSTHPAAPGHVVSVTTSDHRRDTRPQLKLTLRWVPGHYDVPGNEAVDDAAKEAASGHSSPPADLPRANLHQRATDRWCLSPRGLRMAEIDKALPSKTFDELVRSLPRRHANLLQLCLAHVPLQAYFAHIGKIVSPACPTCGEEPESVAHFLCRCPTY